MVSAGGGTGEEGRGWMRWGDVCVCGDSLCTVMLSAELLVMERLACGLSTLATHLYSPPSLVRRGEKVTDTVRGDGTETTTSVPFSILVPPGPTHSMEGVSLSCCSKVTVQERVRVVPAMEGPVLPTLTTGSAGTGGGGECKYLCP